MATYNISLLFDSLQFLAEAGIIWPHTISVYCLIAYNF